jgi:hypothetical protein
MKTIRTIDKLGTVKAEIAALVLLEKSLAAQVKVEMLKADVREAEGDAFRATLTVTERVAVDSKAVAARFPREIAPELYSSSLVESLRVTARTGEHLKAAA